MLENHKNKRDGLQRESTTTLNNPTTQNNHFYSLFKSITFDFV